ncbi:MAG: hypothetical protein ABW252_01660 [Polyangiales bacterium]
MSSPLAFLRLAAAWVVACMLACEPVTAHELAQAPRDPRDPAALASEADPPDAPVLPPAADVGPAQPMARPGFCARPGADAVRDTFCVDAPPAVADLVALQRLLAFDPVRQRNGGLYPNASPDAGVLTADNILLTLGAAMLGHSTALSGRQVSQLNPRAIVMNEVSFMTFQRGVQRVEVATMDRDKHRLAFYLFSFSQRCNEAEHGCRPGDLYTPRIESDWTRVVVQDDEELKNTPSDCRQCHQRGRDKPMLLMRERPGPWVHFFSHDRDVGPDAPATPEPTGRDLVHDYLRAKGDESYAGLPVALLRGTLGFALEGRVGADQPILFDGTTIAVERWVGPDGVRATPGRSATWDKTFAAFKRGEQLAMPFYASRATDPAKLAARTEAYARYRAGTLSADDLPDLSDIFPDDPQTRAEIGLQTTPGASPAETLIQACGSCHNDKLDQSISRARFNVALARLSAAERELAVARLMLPAHDLHAMPPHEARALDADAREALIAYLREPTPAADVERLEHAAREGMAREMPRATGPEMMMPMP